MAHSSPNVAKSQAEASPRCVPADLVFKKESTGTKDWVGEIVIRLDATGYAHMNPLQPPGPF